MKPSHYRRSWNPPRGYRYLRPPKPSLKKRLRARGEVSRKQRYRQTHDYKIERNERRLAHLRKLIRHYREEGYNDEERRDAQYEVKDILAQQKALRAARRESRYRAAVEANERAMVEQALGIADLSEFDIPFE